MVVVKTHTKGDSVLVAVCDEDLLGQTFEEGVLQLDLTSEFYQGQSKTNIEACDIMRNADHLNIVGEKSVKLALDEGLIDEANIKTVDGVPFAQAIILQE
jgi:hypothetical protein